MMNMLTFIIQEHYQLKKRVVFHINEMLNGGIEKVLVELLKALPQDSYELTLLMTYKMGRHEVFLPEVPEYVSVKYLLESDRMNFTRMRKKTRRITALERVWEELVLPVFKKRLIRKKLKSIVAKTDVFIDYDMTLAGYMDILSATKNVAYCHFSILHYWHGIGAKRKMNKLVSRLSRYDKVVMLCKEMEVEAVKSYPILSGNTTSIYNAMDIAHIRERAKLPIDLSDFPEGYIVSVGRLDEKQKDFTTLIEAYAIAVRKYDIKQKLVLVGGGYSMEALKQLAQDKGLDERVHFTGFKSNPYKWIANSTVFVLSSKYEGLPTVLIEAIILGKPAIATACPTGVKELLNYGNAGLLTQPGNAEELALAMHNIVSDEALKQRLLENAQSLIAQFDIKSAIKQIEQELLS